MILPSIWNPHSTNPLCAASQRIAAVTRPAPRRRSASPRPAQCLALLVRDGGPALSGDGITRADAALPAAQDAAPGAALGAPEQDEPPGTALARVADLDLALGATQTLGWVGAVRVEEVLLLAAGGAAAVGRGAGGDRGIPRFGAARRVLANGLGRDGEDGEDEGQVSHSDDFGLWSEWE
ncbi:hypothetical protein MRS44_013060 [Fusarium solani]|uniref:uncharacterized protein n=1 Tax=Fusarium solani TaxID=169388 RepID=UPI0032C3DE5B|nr:hypothetical protein MRS44_013060 [Fusarium solani]